MEDVLEYLLAGNRLSKTEAKDLLVKITAGQFAVEQIASLLTVFRMRPLQEAELEGFCHGMLHIAEPLEWDDKNCVDLCGTGGDGKNTFNISTVSAFIAAGAAVKVVKHGNQGVSSSVGSSNILSHLGYRFTNDKESLKKAFEKIGIVFLHAPLFFPSLKYVAPVRKALAFKTFFNILGPLVNPAQPKNQLLGVYARDLIPLYASTLTKMRRRFQIVHSLKGYDEISLTCECIISTNEGERIVSPQDLGFQNWNSEDISGGNSIQDSATIFKNILQNSATKAQTEVALVNSAAAIQLYFTCSWDEAKAYAQESIASGRAWQILKKAIETDK